MKILQTKMLRKMLCLDEILGLIFNHCIMMVWFLAFALGKYLSNINSKVSKINSMNIALLGVLLILNKYVPAGLLFLCFMCIS